MPDGTIVFELATESLDKPPVDWHECGLVDVE
jgi:hypothetical protein